GVTCHQGLWESIHSRAAPKYRSIQGIHRPSIMSGCGGPESASLLPCVPPPDGTSSCRSICCRRPSLVLSVAMTSPPNLRSPSPPVDSCVAHPLLSLTS